MGESLRASLNAIAEVAPDWLLGIINPDWFDRYVHRFELQRLPKGKSAQETLRRQVGEDSWHRLASRDGRARPPKRQSVPKSGPLAAGVEPTFRAGRRADPRARWPRSPECRAHHFTQ